MKTRNTLNNLNNILFAQLEKLAEDDLIGEELEQELKRSDRMNSVADKIIANARLMLDAQKLVYESGKEIEKLPRILEGQYMSVVVVHKWRDEEKEYLRKIAFGKSYKEITELVNNKFGYDLKVSQVKGVLIRNKIKTGRTGQYEKGHEPWIKGKKGVVGPNSGSFKKGDVPAESKEIGSERKRKGYVQVKVGQPKEWKFKHRMLWEQHHGEIPEGYNLVFADGNKENITIENLLLVSKRELLELNKSNFIQSEPEFTKTALSYVKLKQRVADIRKEVKNERVQIAHFFM